MITNTDITSREIRHYRKSSGILLPRAASSRLVRQLLVETSLTVARFQSSALQGLQEAVEAYLVAFFESKSAISPEVVDQVEY